jgi:hypothetical protein
VLEYNPNKIDSENAVLSYLIDNYFNGVYELVSCDIAIDLHGVDINNVIYEKGSKRRLLTLDYGGSNKTVYIGEGDGRVKIYNKALERKLVNEHWTRYEVTLNIGEFNSHIDLIDIKKDLPTIAVVEQMPLVEDKTLKALFYAVINGYPENELSRKYRDKIHQLIESISHVQVDYTRIRQVIQTYVHQFDNR